jgi:hypothetical protein
MESSVPSGNTSDQPHPERGWARIIGTTVAVLTLALPLLLIGYYSSNSKVETLTPTSYQLPVTSDQ